MKYKLNKPFIPELLLLRVYYQLQRNKKNRTEQTEQKLGEGKINQKSTRILPTEGRGELQWGKGDRGH
jgi:DNA-binding response OmpR family regulator